MPRCPINLASAQCFVIPSIASYDTRGCCGGLGRPVPPNIPPNATYRGSRWLVRCEE